MCERTLIIRWSAIGDIVMSMPVAASLLHSGRHEIAWMCDQRFIELVDGHPFVSRAFSFDRSRFRNTWMLPWKWREQLLAYRATRAFQPTTAIDLQGHTKTSLALKFSGAKKRIMLNPKDGLAARFATEVVRTETELHSIEKALSVLDACAVRERIYRFELLKSAEVQLETPYITIHLGTNHPLKQWKISRFAEVAKQLPHAIVLVGGANEADFRTEYFRLGAKGADLVGKLSLRGLTDVLSKSSLHLSCDTGSAHIAAACGVRCVTVFGHMSPVQFHPYNQPEAVVYANGDIDKVRVEDVLKKVLDGGSF